MAVRYQHLTDKIRADIAQRVGGLIWQAPDAPTGEPGERAKGDTEAA
ncbi:hypothetical protein [Krasilnikovia sp. M28-CT-15]